MEFGTLATIEFFSEASRGTVWNVGLDRYKQIIYKFLLRYVHFLFHILNFSIMISLINVNSLVVYVTCITMLPTISCVEVDVFLM